MKDSPRGLASVTPRAIFVNGFFSALTYVSVSHRTFHLFSRELFAIQCMETNVWLSHGQICYKRILTPPGNRPPRHPHRCRSESHRQSSVLRRPDGGGWPVVWQDAS